MEIRKFNEKDRIDVRRICKETCSDPTLLKHETALYTLYADYYMNEEPDNIFVAVDENDTCQGYILCSSDINKYINSWNEKYLKMVRKESLLLSLIQKYAMIEDKKLAKEGYPTHMHIDISPSFQRNGAGSKLVDALINHLKNKGIDNIHLGCSNNNEVGNSFYKKYGFKVLKNIPTETIYYLDIKD